MRPRKLSVVPGPPIFATTLKGGVITVAAEPLLLCKAHTRAEDLQALLAGGRVLHTKHAVARTVMHVFNVYLMSGNGFHAELMNE
eukprot:12135288-Heterocapsa_arctica.AAC.1